QSPRPAPGIAPGCGGPRVPPSCCSGLPGGRGTQPWWDRARELLATGPMRVGLAPDHVSPLPRPPAEPQILSPPYDVWNVTGQDVIFGCEVFAYPMASIEWRKDGTEMLLPGDDPHISFRGGPQKYEVTAWLQIQAVRVTDEGTYRCFARNKVGQAMALASLTVYCTAVIPVRRPQGLSFNRVLAV
uniref:Kazal type serine peptidase inhibitor domain 1 n=1 Tax=Crocodylus porosus TaxID=8502 RepID=A0A7M4FZA6_CROPO